MCVFLIVTITEIIRLFTASIYARERKSERSKRKVRGGGGGVCKRSLPFCTGVQFSRDFLRAFNDRIKIRENRGLRTVWKLSARSTLKAKIVGYNWISRENVSPIPRPHYAGGIFKSSVTEENSFR